jgi:hypothetical protein
VLSRSLEGCFGGVGETEASGSLDPGSFCDLIVPTWCHRVGNSAPQSRNLLHEGMRKVSKLKLCSSSSVLQCTFHDNLGDDRVTRVRRGGRATLPLWLSSSQVTDARVVMRTCELLAFGTQGACPHVLTQLPHGLTGRSLGLPQCQLMEMKTKNCKNSLSFTRVFLNAYSRTKAN